MTILDYFDINVQTLLNEKELLHVQQIINDIKK